MADNRTQPKRRKISTRCRVPDSKGEIGRYSTKIKSFWTGKQQKVDMLQSVESVESGLDCDYLSMSTRTWVNAVIAANAFTIAAPPSFGVQFGDSSTYTYNAQRTCPLEHRQSKIAVVGTVYLGPGSQDSRLKIQDTTWKIQDIRLMRCTAFPRQEGEYLQMRS